MYFTDLNMDGSVLVHKQAAVPFAPTYLLPYLFRKAQIDGLKSCPPGTVGFYQHNSSTFTCIYINAAGAPMKFLVSYAAIAGHKTFEEFLDSIAKPPHTISKEQVRDPAYAYRMPEF